MRNFDPVGDSVQKDGVYTVFLKKDFGGWMDIIKKVSGGKSCLTKRREKVTCSFKKFFHQANIFTFFRVEAKPSSV